MSTQPEYGVRLHDTLGDAPPVTFVVHMPDVSPSLAVHTEGGDILIADGRELLALLEYLDKFDRDAIRREIKWAADRELEA